MFSMWPISASMTLSGLWRVRGWAWRFPVPCVRSPALRAPRTWPKSSNWHSRVQDFPDAIADERGALDFDGSHAGRRSSGGTTGLGAAAQVRRPRFAGDAFQKHILAHGRDAWPRHLHFSV